LCWETLRSLVAVTALANGRFRRFAVRWKLEEACWRRSNAHCRRWRWRHRHAPGTQTEPQLEAATSTGVILPETGQFLLLCSLQLWHQLQRCRETRARVQVFKRILLPFYRNSLPRMIRFLGKRTVTIEHSTCVNKLAAVTGLLVKFLYIEPKEEHHNCN